MDDASVIIPELAEWNDGKGISVEQWISAIGRYDHFIAYCTIIWPEFFEYQGCVFRYPVDVDQYKEWMRLASGNKRQVEAGVNHLHILDLFPNSEFEPSSQAVQYLASRLKEAWSCKLARDFPGRTFGVKLIREGSGEPRDCQITFFQKTEEGEL